MVMDFGHHNMISPQGLFWFPCGAGCSCVMIKIKKGQLLGKKKGFTLGSIPSSLSSKPCPKYVRIVFYRYVSVCVFFSSFLTLAGTYTLTLTLQRPRDGSLVVFSWTQNPCCSYGRSILAIIKTECAWMVDLHVPPFLCTKDENLLDLRWVHSMVNKLPVVEGVPTTMMWILSCKSSSSSSKPWVGYMNSVFHSDPKYELLKRLECVL